jgi:Transglutaminase-like superfamily
MIWLKLLIRKYETLRHLSARERSLLFQALVLLPAVAVMLYLRGLKFTQDLLARLPQQPLQDEVAIEAQVWMTVRMVRVAIAYNRPWANCLKRSLVLWALLRVQGIPSNLRIGVERQAEKFSAHAWVEWKNIVLNDTEDVGDRFSAFERLFEKSLPSLH